MSEEQKVPTEKERELAEAVSALKAAGRQLAASWRTLINAFVGGMQQGLHPGEVVESEPVKPSALLDPAHLAYRDEVPDEYREKIDQWWQNDGKLRKAPGEMVPPVGLQFLEKIEKPWGEPRLHYIDECRLSNNNSRLTYNFSLYQDARPAKQAHFDA